MSRRPFPRPRSHPHRHGRPAPVPPGRPLLVTADELLLDDLLRLSAAAGVGCEVAHDATSARAAWIAAPLVIAGADLLDDLVRAAPSRRPGVVLVGLDLDDAGIWERAVSIGAETVVFLPDAEPWLVDRLADAAEATGPDAVVVGVVGGRGGAGASVLATALSLAGARRGLRTMLVDADPLGGGIDLVLGSEDTRGLRWPELVGSRGRVNGTALQEALPRVEDLVVLSWDRGDVLSIPAEAMRAVLAASRRSCDLVVVDLPRRVDAAAEEVLAACRTTLLVVPAEVRATASAARVATLVSLHTADLRVVVRGPAPSGLGADVVAEALGLPLAGDVRAEPGLSEMLERGQPPTRGGRGPLAAFCSTFLATLLPTQEAA